MRPKPEHRALRLGLAEAETIALKALFFLLEDPDRTSRFVALTGFTPDEIRTHVQDPVLLGGVLDHLLADEATLIAFAESQAIDPALPARARALLPGAAPA
ncbi:DUF3572 domain-containing protein [Desertibaculum subflavum]|uniref:DUF3572 domain-containing protein n=1 Tax=Desertibaculum subflavum TaxID=2268458 RepID=UPI000E672610